MAVNINNVHMEENSRWNPDTNVQTVQHTITTTATATNNNNKTLNYVKIADRVEKLQMRKLFRFGELMPGLYELVRSSFQLLKINLWPL